nr:MAG TPA: hypothetical protein [Caudoviricetes sp.]
MLVFPGQRRILLIVTRHPTNRIPPTAFSMAQGPKNGG